MVTFRNCTSVTRNNCVHAWVSLLNDSWRKEAYFQLCCWNVCSFSTLLARNFLYGHWIALFSELRQAKTTFYFHKHPLEHTLPHNTMYTHLIFSSHVLLRQRRSYNVEPSYLYTQLALCMRACVCAQLQLSTFRLCKGHTESCWSEFASVSWAPTDT